MSKMELRLSKPWPCRVGERTRKRMEQPGVQEELDCETERRNADVRDLLRRQIGHEYEPEPELDISAA